MDNLPTIDSLPPTYHPYISTSEEGTTSEQWTKCSSPTCPLFGGSTIIQHPFLCSNIFTLCKFFLQAFPYGLYIPKSLISVLACPVCPSESVTVHVCVPLSLERRMSMVISLEELLETEQLEQVEDQR